MNPNTQNPINQPQSQPQLQPQPPMQAQNAPASLPTEAPFNEAVSVLLIAEIVSFVISKLGSSAIMYLAINSFAKSGGSFDSGTEAIGSIIGLVALVALYAWTTDFMIRFYALKRLKFQAKGMFLAIYYALMLFVLPSLISVISPVISADQGDSRHINAASYTILLIISAAIGYIVELFLYRRLSKSSR